MTVTRFRSHADVVQGVSRTLKEEVHYVDDRVTSVVWQTSPFNPGPQYDVLRFTDVPSIETILINRPEQPHSAPANQPSARCRARSATRCSRPRTSESARCPSRPSESGPRSPRSIEGRPDCCLFFQQEPVPQPGSAPRHHGCEPCSLRQTQQPDWRAAAASRVLSSPQPREGRWWRLGVFAVRPTAASRRCGCAPRRCSTGPRWASGHRR